MSYLLLDIGCVECHGTGAYTDFVQLLGRFEKPIEAFVARDALLPEVWRGHTEQTVVCGGRALSVFKV